MSFVLYAAAATTALEQSKENHDLLWAAIITAGLSFLGVLVVAWLANVNRKVARDVAAQILSELDTGNGHSAGDALARIENQLWRHEDRLDGIDVRLVEGMGTFGTITEQLTNVDETLANVDDRLSLVDASLDTVNERFDAHEAETRPIRDWVVEQIEAEHDREG